MMGTPSDGTRTLVVVRHAKAVEPGGIADFNRPLADRGRIEAGLAGTLVRATLAPPVVAYVSPALRTRQTWELIGGGVEAAVEFPPLLYGVDVEELITVLHGTDEDVATVVLVGHNPACAELVSHLTGEPVASFPTSAVARLQGIDEWHLLDRARLISFDVPRSQPG